MPRDRRRDPDSGEFPRSRKPGVSPVVIILAVLGGAFVLCAGGVVAVFWVGTKGANNAVANRGPLFGEDVQDAQIGKEVRIGDLGVTIESVELMGFVSWPEFGRPISHPGGINVNIRLVCHNPNRELAVRGQSDAAEMTDDVGNVYKPLIATDEFGNQERVDRQIRNGFTRPVRSTGPEQDRVIFKDPVPGASQVTILLDASRYGGRGKLRVVVPRAAWEPKR